MIKLTESEWFELIKDNPTRFRNCPQEFRSYRILRTAVEQDPWAISYVRNPSLDLMLFSYDIRPVLTMTITLNETDEFLDLILTKLTSEVVERLNNINWLRRNETELKLMYFEDKELIDALNYKLNISPIKKNQQW